MIIRMAAFNSIGEERDDGVEKQGEFDRKGRRVVEGIEPHKAGELSSLSGLARDTERTPLHDEIFVRPTRKGAGVDEVRSGSIGRGGRGRIGRGRGRGRDGDILPATMVALEEKAVAATDVIMDPMMETVILPAKGVSEGASGEVLFLLETFLMPGTLPTSSEIADSELADVRRSWSESALVSQSRLSPPSGKVASAGELWWKADAEADRDGMSRIIPVGRFDRGRGRGRGRAGEGKGRPGSARGRGGRGTANVQEPSAIVVLR
jgi:hypothetical protein